MPAEVQLAVPGHAVGGPDRRSAPVTRRHHELSGAGPGRRAQAVTADRIPDPGCPDPGCPDRRRLARRAWRAARASASRWAWLRSSARWACPRACTVVCCIIVVSSDAESELAPTMPLRPAGADRAIAQD